jgi:hypothetical protein
VELNRTERTEGRTATIRLFVASFLSLYIELVLIRWTPATVHIVGFFTNLVLIASFLGLGLGLARPYGVSRAAWQASFRMSVWVCAFMGASLLNLGVPIPKGADYGINEATRHTWISAPLPVVLVLIFALVVWATIPFGRLVAAFFDRIEPVRAYSVNIAGSLAGIVGFSLLSWLHSPPWVWFGVAAVVIAWFAPRLRTLVAAGLLFAALGVLYIRDTGNFRDGISWSPYYKIVAHAIDARTRKLDEGFALDVNGQFLLSGFDLRPGAGVPAGAPSSVAALVASLTSYYDLPFVLHPPDRVLVLGAGAGNDVAAALRRGAGTITAVEIDPVVLRFGRHHPERPYASPRVRTVLGDARAFLNRTTQRYDVIVFATLDAHGLLANASNIRLDSFVYTLESLRAAKAHLAAGGTMVLSFGPFREDIQFRQYEMVRRIFGHEPLYLVHTNGHRSIAAGRLPPSGFSLPRDWRLITRSEVAAGLARYPHARAPATDDWPHLFVRTRRIPREYTLVLAGIALVSLALVRGRFGSKRPLDGHFFFLGAGFLLMETKSVTEYALLIGSTWVTNAAVFSIILAVILAANLIVLKRKQPVPLRAAYTLLFILLAAGFVWPLSRVAPGFGVGSIAVAGAYLGMPVFLAALVFATTLRDAGVGSTALAANLLGAVAGGLAEYLSLTWGIRALSLVALVMYAASFFFLEARRRAPAS